MADWFSFIKEIRLVPLWVLLGLTIGCDLLLLFSSLQKIIPIETVPWLNFAAIFLNPLTATKGASDFLVLRSSGNSKPLRISFTPLQNQCHWNFGKQPDGTTLTQISVGLLATNLTDKPIGLSNPRVIRSPVGLGLKTIHFDVSIQSPDGREFGSTAISKYRLVPNLPQTVVLHGFFPKKPWFQRDGDLAIRIVLTDTQGISHSIALSLSHV
jgi:hypothetical protein